MKEKERKKGKERENRRGKEERGKKKEKKKKSRTKKRREESVKRRENVTFHNHWLLNQNSRERKRIFFFLPFFLSFFFRANKVFLSLSLRGLFCLDK